MFNCIKSISEVINESISIDRFLLNADNYYAHVPHDKSSSQKAETLNEHILLVQKKFEMLAKVHQIDGVIDKSIIVVFEENKLEFNLSIANFIKKLWVNTIVFHDYGKINPNFQANVTKMNNPHFRGKENVGSPISTYHSSLGAYLYIVKHFDEISKLDKKYASLLSVICLTFSYSIFKHHGKYLQDNVKEKVAFSTVEVDCMKQYITNYQWNIHEQFSKNVPLNIDKLFTNLGSNLNSFALFSLIKLSFSMLTASDFLASGEYMTGIKIEEKDLGVLSKQRIEEVYSFVSQSEWICEGENKYNYNKATFEKASNDYNFQNPTTISNQNLNLLRQEMGIEVLQTIRKNASNNLFYIEAPTGGGKTNLSFLATIELLKLNESLNKVFYVFPFTTLVTQTQKSLIETLGLSIDEVIMLSSKSGFKEPEIEDDNYGGQKKYYLDNLFSFYPFCLLTHIKFFNILKTNAKEENYLLHRMANSVVVIDELQAYSPSEWDKVIYFIKNYAHFYNIKFIVMSATLPKLGSLDILKKYDNDFIYLLDNAKERYFKNPNFAQRVDFNLDLFDATNLTLDTLSSLVFKKSNEYAEKDFCKAKPKGSIYTIIEFIFKKSASEFYEIVNKENDFFDKIFVLSGTILEHRRKYIINYLKNQDNRKKKILLITTQVVEAGVDIDMDLGFKDKSLIDSDEQLAGRINRNVNKQDCVLHIFNYNNEKIIYGNDKRYENTKTIPKEDYLRILKTKVFDEIYNKILANIDSWNKKEGAIGFDEYEQHIKQLRFQSVASKFQLISKDTENISVFIPINIPIKVDGASQNTFDEVFSKTEINYLAQNGISVNQQQEIEGSAVFDLYLALINTKGDITIKKISGKIMQGIISKFVISMMGTEKIKTQLILFQDVDKSDKGYIYLNHWAEVYDEKFGLSDVKFNSNETQFL